MADENPYRQAREVENDALARMTGPSPKEVGWAEGFAAGRAALPDPHDWTAAITTLRHAMCCPAGREQVEKDLLRPFGYPTESVFTEAAALPDERLREAERIKQERNLARCEAFDRASEPRPENPTPEERVRDGSHLPGGYRTLYVPTSVALRAVADARDDERRRIRGLVANRAADLLVTDSPLGSALADLWKDLIDGSSE